MLQRLLVFALASTSIGALLAQMYGVASMQAVTLGVCVPSLAALALLARSPDLREIVVGGALIGLVAALAYDLYRVPFVLQGFPLFKVFPRFGAMLLGEPLEQASYSAAAQAAGWLYHFSNGATFGIMYAAAVPRRTWWSGLAFALWIEGCLLLSPYATFFGLALNATFVGITLSAHAVFGVCLGACPLPRGLSRTTPA